MRVLNWALDAQKTVGGKIISVILSVALIFSFSNFFYGDNAFATEDNPSEFSELNDKPAVEENNVDTAVSVQAPEPQPSTETEDTSITPESSSAQNSATQQAAVEETSSSADTKASVNQATEEKTEEAASAATEETAVPFEGYATVGNVIVKVTADAGVVPEGTIVKAVDADTEAVKAALENSLEADGKALGKYKAIDVSLFDSNGNEIQPNGNVNVCFFGTDLEGEGVSVYHVSDDAAAVTPVNARQADASVQSFDVSHFSIYVTADTVKGNDPKGLNKDLSKYSYSNNDRVYVFLKFTDSQELDKLGINSSSNGVYGNWVTIGYIDLQGTGYSKPNQKKTYEDDDLTEDILKNDWINSDKFVALNGYENLREYLSYVGVTGYKVKADGNATGYPEEDKKITWHMNFEIPAFYSVAYDWGTENVPEGVTLPIDNGSYVKGQTYTADQTFTAGYTVEHKDQYGNVDGIYTFSGWTDSNNGVMGDANVTITGSWSYEPQTVATHTVTYNWGDVASEISEAYTLPTDTNAYVNGQAYTVDATEYAAVDTYDEYGNVNGTWTFSGWDKTGTQTMGTEDVTINGSWTYEEKPVATHTVAYDWGTENVPEGVTLPIDNGSYVKGQTYTADQTFTAGYTVEHKDQYGNVDGIYTFSGWTDSNNGVMGDANVTITGSWSYEPQTVATHTVTYNWGDVASEISEAYTLPTDTNAYVNGQAYTVDATEYAAVDTYDEYGNVNGTWTFSGWDKTGTQTMGTEDVTINGSWTYEEKPVATHTVAVTVENGTATAGNATVINGADFSVSFQANENYILDSVTVDGQAATLNEDGSYNFAQVTTDHVIHVVYAADTIGTDPINPDQGDGIPDMYQVRVDFVANNGTVNIGHTYVTLLDANGNPAVNGTGYLQQAQIPTATANDGFDQASLAWDTTPTAQVAITGAMTFTANFTAIPAPAPTPTPAPAPAPATPAAAPAAPAAPAAAPAAPAVVIPDEENPLAAPEQEIADDENPLAAFDHEECWVHWFIIAGILLTIIYGAVVVLRRTRNTKHIDKMEKDLIGTTDESTVTVGSAHHSHA